MSVFELPAPSIVFTISQSIALIDLSMVKKLLLISEAVCHSSLTLHSSLGIALKLTNSIGKYALVPNVNLRSLAIPLTPVNA